jgi:3-hydroxybutyryl-CoA dehydrogenase
MVVLSAGQALASPLKGEEDNNHPPLQGEGEGGDGLDYGDSMKLENIKRVAVIGAGTMGSQIAQLFSQAGRYPVMVYDLNDELVSHGIQSIKENLKRYFVDKGLMTQIEMDAVAGRIKGTADLLEAVENADFVIECVFENLDLKKSVFKQLDEKTPPHSILASNTSNLNITEIASMTKRADKIVGMHFFNPVSIGKIVEVVRGSFTSDETIETILALSQKLGKEPILCKDFSFGFLANRAYTPMFLETIQMVWERVAPPEDIDKALKLGYGLPIGPLELGDLIGAWKIFAMSEEDRMREVGPEKGHLHPLIRMMVRAGYTGGKGKKGIYDFYKEVLMAK